MCWVDDRVLLSFVINAQTARLKVTMMMMWAWHTMLLGRWQGVAKLRDQSLDCLIVGGCIVRVANMRAAIGLLPLCPQLGPLQLSVDSLYPRDSLGGREVLLALLALQVLQPPLQCC